jgi:hypothetical protein
MRKLTLLFVFLISVAFIYAQADRRVLVEEATNASCGPCASQNPAFDALLQANPDMVAVIKYHSWWPGVDPMYDQNVEDNAARIDYYGINSVPRAVVDGQFNGQPAQVSQSMLNNYANQPSPFEEIDIYHYLSADGDSIYVFMRIQAAQDISENFMRGHCAVVEKLIDFNSPPGFNGETDFYDVMKKMLPSASGTALKANWVDGEYKIIAQTWKLENVYDNDQLSVVGFVQNSNTKDVHQSGISADEPFEPLFDVDGAPAGITNLTSTTCLSAFEPELSIANFGADNLVSADIYYSVNGGEEQMYSWSGNVEYLKLKSVLLPEIEFNLMEENQMKVYFSNVNGTGDEYPLNDTLYFSFDRSIVVQDEVNLMIKLDDNPEETTWEVVNPEGEVVFSGGPYSTPGAFISETLEFDMTECLLFTIYDAGGNGISLPGFFSLFKGSTQILTGSDFGSEASQMFLGEVSVGVEEFTYDKRLSVYPNPVTDAGVVSFVLFNDTDVEIRMLNQLGQQVKSIQNGNLNAGTHNLAFETAGLPEGVYFLEVNLGTDREVRKISILE